MSDPLDSLRDRAIEDLTGLPELTWFSSEPLGHHSSLSTVSSGPVAVLAGFTLASGATLATTDGLESSDAAAIGVFALAVACLFVALVFVTEANSNFSTPGDRLDWYPEASVSRRFLETQRLRQRNDFLRFDSFRRRTLQWYALGAALALIGLALVLIARVDGSGLRFAADEDTFSDVSAFAGALAVIAAAIYILSYAPFNALTSLATVRDARVLAAARRRWPNLVTVTSTDLSDAAMLRDWPPTT